MLDGREMRWTDIALGRRDDCSVCAGRG
jgi:hypothetical protein